jgi:hypothetical protein
MTKLTKKELNILQGTIRHTMVTLHQRGEDNSHLKELSEKLSLMYTDLLLDEINKKKVKG